MRITLFLTDAKLIALENELSNKSIATLESEPCHPKGMNTVRLETEFINVLCQKLVDL